MVTIQTHSHKYKDFVQLQWKEFVLELNKQHSSKMIVENQPMQMAKENLKKKNRDVQAVAGEVLLVPAPGLPNLSKLCITRSRPASCLIPHPYWPLGPTHCQAGLSETHNSATCLLLSVSAQLSLFPPDRVPAAFPECNKFPCFWAVGQVTLAVCMRVHAC